MSMVSNSRKTTKPNEGIDQEWTFDIGVNVECCEQTEVLLSLFQ